MKVNNQAIDFIAITSSILCAIHCAVLPILISFSALGSLQFLDNEWIEWSLIIFGFLLAIGSLLPSYQKVHRVLRPLWYAGIGFLFIAVSRLEFSEWWETGNTVFGACIVAYAHYRNWKLMKERRHIH